MAKSKSPRPGQEVVHQVTFCGNHPCREVAAVYYFSHGRVVFLCKACGQAFRNGQCQPEAELAPIENLSP